MWSILLFFLTTKLISGNIIEFHKPQPLERIINGTAVTSVDKYPYYAYFARTLNGNTKFCGATLISDRVLLTAAHCTDEGAYYKVFFGLTDWGQVSVDGLVKPATMQSFEVLQLIQHPDAVIVPNESQIYLRHDIMLVVLDRDVVGPTKIRLDDGSFLKKSGDELSVMGFGSPDGIGAFSDQMLDAKVDYITNEECTNYWLQFDEMLGDSVVCAKRQGNGPCYGDSGGPLVKHYDGDPVQIGVVSFVNSEVNCDFTSVYASVADHFVWIKDTMCGQLAANEFCDDNGGSGNTTDDASSSPMYNIHVIIAGTLLSVVCVFSSILVS